MAAQNIKTYRIESSFKLTSEWFPVSEFTRTYNDLPEAVSTAIEGVDDPGEEEVRVVCIEDGETVWRSTDHEYE